MKPCIGLPFPTWDIERANPPANAPTSIMPATLAAGQVVTLGGTVAGRSIVCNGTATNPCWILGTPGMRLTGAISITGTYAYVDGITVAGAHELYVSGDHLVIRHSDISGTLTDRHTAGLGLSGTNIVAFQNKVHHHGDVHADDDQDAHGISVSRGSRGIWILENECWANSGDGINCNPYPYDTAGLTAISYVFIGGNVCHDNKQTGIWCKMSTDIIVSENESYGHHASNSSRGDGMGYQYSTQRIWFLKNNLHDNDVGIGVSTNFDGAPDSGCSILGNTITRANGTSCGDGERWSCAAIYLTGDAYTYVINNTILESVDGIHATRGKGLYVSGTVGNTHVVSTNPVMPWRDLAADFKQLYGLDISSLTGTAPIPVPPPPDPPAPAPLPKCSNISNVFLRLLAYLSGRCVR